MSIASMIGQLVEIFRGWTPPTPTPTPTPDPYVLPPATAETLGGVKVGDGLSVQPDGTLSANGGGAGEFVIGSSGNDMIVESAPCTVEEFQAAILAGNVPWTVRLSHEFPDTGMWGTHAYGYNSVIFNPVAGTVFYIFSFCLDRFNPRNMGTIKMCQIIMPNPEREGFIVETISESGGDSFIFEAQDGGAEDVYTLVSAPCTVADFTERARTGGLPYRIALRWKDLGEKFHCTEMIANEITTEDNEPIQFSCIQWSNEQTSPVKLDVNNGEFRLSNYNLPE